MKVTHVKHRTFTVYIGRPSIFGNPFIVGKDGTRWQCIRKFEKFARSNEGVLNAIRKLPEDAVLGCHCKPKACHGDVIVTLWKEMRTQTIDAIIAARKMINAKKIPRSDR